MKPWHGTTANRHLHGSGEGMENKGKKYDANIGAAAIGEKARLGTKWRWTVKKSSL